MDPVGLERVTLARRADERATDEEVLIGELHLLFGGVLAIEVVEPLALDGRTSPAV